jgi:predicted ATPase
LRANLLRIEKQDLLEFEDGRRVKLAQASSGQQEILPLLLLLARFFSLRLARGRAVYIEEPEAHLFPSTQKLVVELMARSFRARSGEMSLVITTHSPYILTSVNNLLQAGQVYSKASPEIEKNWPNNS